MAERTRRVVTLDGAGRIAVAEQPLPALEAGRVLVEVKACLVSPGTELGGVSERRANPVDRPPRAFGYGNAGVVVDVGEGVRGLTPGMRVACMGAGYALHASHVLVPQNLVVPMPEGQSFEEAAFAHLAATGLWAVRRAEVEIGQNVAVFGLGLVGQIAAQFARVGGGRVMAIDRVPLRLAAAERCGADLAIDFSAGDLGKAAAEFTAGHGMDAAILAFGGDANAAIRSAVSILKVAPDTHPYGVISIVGGASFEASWPVNFGNVDVRASSRPGPGYHDEAWEHGADYPPVFVPWTTRRNLEVCLDYAAAGRIHFGPLITHRAPLDDAAAACEELIAHPDRALGVILEA